MIHHRATALAVASVLAACGSSPDDGNNTDPVGSLQAMGGELADPAAFTVAAASVSVDGWVAVWHEFSSSHTLAGAVFLTAGSHTDITVPLDPPVGVLAATSGYKLRVSLHADAPKDGAFTATDTLEDGPDPVVKNAAGQFIVGVVDVSLPPQDPNGIIVDDQTLTKSPPSVSVGAAISTVPTYLVIKNAAGDVLGSERLFDRNYRNYNVSIDLPQSWTPAPLTAAMYANLDDAPDLTAPVLSLAGQPVTAAFNVTYPPDNTLSVSDQTLTSWGYKIAIGAVDVDELPAIVAVHADDGGAPGEVLGTFAVATSPKVAFSVNLTRFVEPTETLWVVVYSDAAPVGSITSADVPLLGNDGQPLRVAITVTNASCDGLKTKVCDPDHPDVISWLDRCDAPSTTVTPCGDDDVCDDTGPYVACRAAPDPCAGLGAILCVATDLTATWQTDACGVPLRVATRCAATERCNMTGDVASCVTTEACAADPASIACLGEDACDGPAQLFCDDADRSVIKWLDACGGLLDTEIPCRDGYLCSESAGGVRCVPDNACGGNTSTVCVEDDPGHVYWVDACGKLTGSLYSCGVATCDDSGGDAECKLVGTCEDVRKRTCDAGDTTVVRLGNDCGDDLGVFSVCANGKQCVEATAGDARCECVPSDEVRCFGTSKLYEPSGIAKVDSCGNWVDEIVETCLNGEVCENTESGPACGTSLTNRDSPMYHRGCSFPDYLRYKTDLDVECRCRRHAAPANDIALYDMAGNQACANQADSFADGWTMAEGPHFRHMVISQNGGGVYSATHNELFATKHFTDSTYEGAGMVIGYDITTGKRRVVSGRFPEPEGSYTMYGSGFESVRAVGVLRHEATTLPGAWDLEMGTDGKLYVWGSRTGNKEITRVDPDTGLRTLVWRQALESDTPVAPEHAQCYSTRPKTTFHGGFIPVELEDHAFAMGPDGTFYLGFRNNSAEGNGVIKIAADGSTCTVVSRWQGTMGAIGGGASPQYSNLEGFLVRSGVLYATLQIGKNLLAINLASGDRALIANPVGSVESTPGQSTMFWDTTRDLLVTAGGVQPYLVVFVDVASGERQTPFLVSPGAMLESAPPWLTNAHGAIDNGNYMGYGAMMIDPDDNDHLYMVIKWGLIKYEITTGNSYVMSQ